jgi:hypothetical protein
MTVRRVNSSYVHSLDSSASFGTNKGKYQRASTGISSPIFFLTNGTWVKPSYVEYIDLIVIGGGGGGGSGNYGGGGGGGNIRYIKKMYVGDYNTWYIYIGSGGVGGGKAGFDGRNNAWGESGGPTIVSPDATSYSRGNLAAVGNSRTIVSMGGGGGGSPSNFGYFGATGGGSGSGAGFGSFGRISGAQYWTSGDGYNGGAGASGASGGGGSATSQGGGAGTNAGGVGADGPLLQAPLPPTFVNSSGTTLTTRFGGGGGGSGATTDGAGGAGGGATGKNVNSVPNTGGGGSGNSGNGGSGIVIILENRD